MLGWGAWAIRAGVSSKWLDWMGPVSRTEDWTGGGDVGVITSWGAEWTTSLGSMHSAEGGPRRDTHTQPLVSALNAPCQMSAMSLPQGPSYTLAPEAGTAAQPTRRCGVTPPSPTTAIRAARLAALPSAAPDHLHCCTLFCKKPPGGTPAILAQTHLPRELHLQASGSPSATCSHVPCRQRRWSSPSAPDSLLTRDAAGRRLTPVALSSNSRGHQSARHQS